MEYKSKAPIKFGEDVILVVGGQEFFVHKKVLADKSEVFDQMFNGNSKEANENRIKIKDANAKMFGQLLELIYTGKIEGAVDPEKKTGFQAASREKAEANEHFLKHVLLDIMGAQTCEVLKTYEHWQHNGGFKQDFVSNFPELLKVANRFDVTDALGKYLAEEVERQSKYKRHEDCIFCERIDALEKCLGKSISSYK